jgi:uncharacterized protein with WD repeat
LEYIQSNIHHFYSIQLYFKLNFYEHESVKNVDFSPNEEYMVTFNGTVNDVNSTENYIIWNVQEIDKLRSFKA